jgi:hypothetical protein
MSTYAREMVHKAFKTTTSRGEVAPFCCMLDGTHPCGVLCDTLTAAIEPLEPGLLRAVELLRDREAMTNGGPRLSEIRSCIAMLNDERKRRALAGAKP